MALSPLKPGIDLGIVTTNPTAMLPFYRDVLGLDYQGEMPMPGGKGVMHRMLCGNSLIKLVVLPEGIAPAAPGGIQKAAGYRYWTITISGIDATVAACAAAGAKVVVPVSEIRPGTKIAIVADPDGNWVEFLQTA